MRRPKTAAQPGQERKDSGAGSEVIDDFETVGQKAKKPVRPPFKKLAPDSATDAAGFSEVRKTSDVAAQAMAGEQPATKGNAKRKVSDAAGPIVRKTSDAAGPIVRKNSDAAGPIVRKTSDAAEKASAPSKNANN